MKFKLYFAIGGEHFDAESFHRLVQIPGATIKQDGYLGQKIDPTRFRKWNVWESARIDGSIHPGDDINALLENNAAAISRLQGRKDCESWVGIVGYYLEGEEPRGFSFQSDTIQALAKIGASIEIDTVYDPTEIQKYQTKLT